MVLVRSADDEVVAVFDLHEVKACARHHAGIIAGAELLPAGPDLPGAALAGVVTPVIAVPAGPPIAGLGQQRPYLPGRRLDGDRPGGAPGPGPGNVVARHRPRDLLPGGPPAHLPGPDETQVDDDGERHSGKRSEKTVQSAHRVGEQGHQRAELGQRPGHHKEDASLRLHLHLAAPPAAIRCHARATARRRTVIPHQEPADGTAVEAMVTSRMRRTPRATSLTGRGTQGPMPLETRASQPCGGRSDRGQSPRTGQPQEAASARVPGHDPLRRWRLPYTRGRSAVSHPIGVN